MANLDFVQEPQPIARIVVTETIDEDNELAADLFVACSTKDLCDWAYGVAEKFMISPVQRANRGFVFRVSPCFNPLEVAAYIRQGPIPAVVDGKITH